MNTSHAYMDPLWPQSNNYGNGPSIRIDTTVVHQPHLQQGYSSSSPYTSNGSWATFPPTPESAAGESNYPPRNGFQSGHPGLYFPTYPSPHGQTMNPEIPSICPPTATMLSLPYVGRSSPTTPASDERSGLSASPVIGSPLPLSSTAAIDRPLFTHRQQTQFFKEALSLPMSGLVGPFVQQHMYKPHTNSDRKRYVEEVELEAPIHFWVDHPEECGIPLLDALHSRVRRLRNRDETVFEGRGPSVSIRLEWPGYRQWSRQIPTRDFRSPPGPITRAKLAKNVAKCVQRFILERQTHALEDDTDPKWKVGPGPRQINMDDLILVSMHHVSMGSWQPQLRLRRPFH
ncbi:hypothetical protein BD779DRAFT_1521163 [Infundibulicybe gibba]|nr:hypothetical protein BD779DRAFT_1521163 [Infundibulicybe gibba]